MIRACGEQAGPDSQPAPSPRRGGAAHL